MFELTGNDSSIKTRKNDNRHKGCRFFNLLFVLLYPQRGLLCIPDELLQDLIKLVTFVVE